MNIYNNLESRWALDDLELLVRVTAASNGSPVPEIEIDIGPNWPYRRLRAALLGVAMEVEILTPADEGWDVEFDVLADGRGRCTWCSW